MTTEIRYDGDLAGKAWDQVSSGIEGATAELAALRSGFVEIMREGQAFRKFEKVLAERLGQVEWTWPWFEDWELKFSDWQLWPYLWPDLLPEEDPEELAEYSAEELAVFRRESISQLILQTASMIFYRNMHLANGKSHHRWKLVHLGDPAEMRVSQPYEAAILAGDFSEIPPFFPGDRTSMQNTGPFRQP